MDKRLIVFEREVEKGFIPERVCGSEKLATLMLIEYLLKIENNIKKMPQPVLNMVMKNQITYPDMFMKNILRDQKNNNSISTFPKGWFDIFEESFLDEYVIDNYSNICCYNETSVSVSIFEMESIPLLIFRSVADYASFFLSIYAGDFLSVENIFNTQKLFHSKPDEMLNHVLVNIPAKEAGVLIDFFLYKAHFLQALQNTQVMTQFINTNNHKLLSQVSFPYEFLKNKEVNFYGRLLMKVRNSFL